MGRPGPLTVTELTQMIASTLDAAFPSLWVEGELADVSTSTSGHVYFNLRDGSSQLKAVMFRRTAARLPFTPENGSHVLVSGKLSVYEPRGEYQIVVEEMEPRGIGALQAAIQKLYERLEEEGLFDQERKIPLPPFPSAVGIVTSSTGAAIRDIQKVFREREAGMRVVLSPALVQGENAPQSIVDAIRLLEDHGDVDLIIIGRGGGSFEDLLAFSDEGVVRAVAGCLIPTVSAVGHEIDTVLTDMAADVRAPTPSAAAQIVAKSRPEVEATLRHLLSGLVSSARWKIENARKMLLAAQSGLVPPQHSLQRARMRLDELGFRMQNRVNATLSEKRSHLTSLDGLLASMGPESVLKRGYAILLKEDGAAVRRPHDVDLGEELSARLSEGSINVKVTDVDK